jgi:hypothetical protein
MNGMSAANRDKAKEYRSAVLQDRRVGFYRQVRDTTEAWLREQAVRKSRVELAKKAHAANL